MYVPWESNGIGKSSIHAYPIINKVVLREFSERERTRETSLTSILLNYDGYRQPPVFAVEVLQHSHLSSLGALGNLVFCPWSHGGNWSQVSWRRVKMEYVYAMDKVRT
jgi:hypothetical protein